MSERTLQLRLHAFSTVLPTFARRVKVTCKKKVNIKACKFLEIQSAWPALIYSSTEGSVGIR